MPVFRYLATIISASRGITRRTLKRSIPPSIRMQHSLLARQFSASVVRSADSPALSKAIRQIQDKFVEAKDEYEVALESQGTTYAVEDNETAREIAAELSQLYEGLMSGAELSDAEKQTIKEKLSARIRELTNGVENNLHDSD